MVSGVLTAGGVEIIAGRFIESIIWNYLLGKNIVSGVLSDVSPLYGVSIVFLAVALVVFERFMIHKENINSGNISKIRPLNGNFTKSCEFFFKGNRIICIDGPINHISSVDVICTSENNYLEPAKLSSSSTSGRVRKAVAKKSISGEIIEDVVINDISEWKRQNNALGKTLPLGTVVETSSGELVSKGIKNIFHVITVRQKENSNEYEMPLDTISSGINEIFRKLNELSLSSVSIPVFGAGSANKDITECIKITCDSIFNSLERNTNKLVYISTYRESDHKKVVAYIKNITNE